MKKVFINFLIFLLPLSVAFNGCNKTPSEEPNENEFDYPLSGWEISTEDLARIPVDITPFLLGSGFHQPGGGNTMKSTVLLDHHFPPVGNQGQFGTCSVWAVGYNFKTALNAIENSWTATELAREENQTSPRDLWFALERRGEGCEGANMDVALTALIKVGAASESRVPYGDMGGCVGTAVGSNTNRIANYRRIATHKWWESNAKNDGMTVNNLKMYLHGGIPIVFAAKLGDRFMRLQGGTVLDFDTYDGSSTNQHAFHAMALTGYDDSRNAFRLINSWGNKWGDGGYGWIDYDFFVNNFAYAAFVAQNTLEPRIPTEAPQPLKRVQGLDLMAYYSEDYPSTRADDIAKGRTRSFSYEVYNPGSIDVLSNRNWTLAYLYYNATDATDFGIIYDEYFTNQAGLSKDGYAPNPNSKSSSGGYFVNSDIPAGEFYGWKYYIAYEMPKISGDYYLLMLVDAVDTLDEVNENNNFYFITAAEGKPLKFVNGVIQNQPTRSALSRQNVSSERRLADTQRHTTITPQNPNAYTPEEIKAVVLHDYRTGALEAKRRTFREDNPKQNVVKRRID